MVKIRISFMDWSVSFATFGKQHIFKQRATDTKVGEVGYFSRESEVGHHGADTGETGQELKEEGALRRIAGFYTNFSRGKCREEILETTGNREFWERDFRKFFRVMSANAGDLLSPWGT